MKFEDRRKMMDALDPELLGGKTPVDKATGYFRWHALQLLEDIADSVSSMSYAYREMLKIQQAKSGLSGMDKSRYGGGAAPAARQPGDGK